MSTKLSFKEALARQGETLAAPPGLSAFPIHRLRLRASATISKPVSLARALVSFGLSLKKAHNVLNRITAGDTVYIELQSEKLTNITATLFELGVEATMLDRPARTDVKRVRESLGVSQAEFAVRFGLELDTVQNWEQQRYSPDPAAQVLLTVIESRPDVVEKALTREARWSSDVYIDASPASFSIPPTWHATVRLPHSADEEQLQLALK